MTLQPPSKHFMPGLQRSASNVFAPVQREFDRFLDQIATGWESFGELDLSPRMDVQDKKDAVEIDIELPGLTRKDVEIAVEDDILTVSGEKKAERETKDDSYRICERSYGAFSRSISLPRSVDADRISATMANGVLKIVAPKDGAAVSKKIAIQPAK
jgi:HSP20 family protein